MKFFYSSLILLGMLIGAAPAPAQTEAPENVSTFSTELPYPSHYIEVESVRLHYIDSGKSEGGTDEQVFLFLHGNPTSSYLWRNVMPHVQPKGRVIALDLIGFGKSDKPQSDYTYQSHSHFVDGFIEEMGLKDIVLVIHDWGSVLGFDYAMRNPDNVRGVAFMEAIVPPAFPLPSLDLWGPAGELFKAFRDPVQGKVMNMDNNYFVEEVLLKGAVSREFSEEEKEAYRAPFPDRDSRFPIYVWPNELPIAGEPERNVVLVTAIGEWLKTSDTPKLLLHAEPGAIIPPQAANWMKENYKALDTVFIGPGSHYIQEDNPELIGRSIAAWYEDSIPR